GAEQWVAAKPVWRAEPAVARRLRPAEPLALWPQALVESLRQPAELRVSRLPAAQAGGEPEAWLPAGRLQRFFPEEPPSEQSRPAFLLSAVSPVSGRHLAPRFWPGGRDVAAARAPSAT